MYLAQATTTRGPYGQNGLSCLRCFELFTLATELVEHPCYEIMRAEDKHRREHTLLGGKLKEALGNGLCASAKAQSSGYSKDNPENQ